MPEQERRPGPGWERIPIPPASPLAEIGTVSAWQRKRTCVISALENAELPDGSGTGPQWHISVSRVAGAGNKRPSFVDVRRALHAFDMKGAEEDNHHPGNARHFWVPVDPSKRVGCECKVTETVVTEKDGYQWTNPTDGTCRGCELERLLGKPCSIHHA